MISLPQLNPTIIAILLCLSAIAFTEGSTTQPIVERECLDHDLDVISNAQTDKEKIVFAKRLLRLPTDAPEGVLWRTYLTRLYNVPPDATMDMMESVQLNRDSHYNHLAEGLPDWFPEELVSKRANYKENVVRPMVWNWLADLSIFASRSDLESAWARKVLIEKRLCAASGKPFRYDELDRRVIINKLGLKPNINFADAIDKVEGIVRIISFGGISATELGKINRHVHREEAQFVLHCSDEASDKELAAKLSLVERAVKLESPKRPGKFMFWY